MSHSTIVSIVFLLLLIQIPDKSIAQNAYDHWLKNQELETHMRCNGDYTTKSTYKSTTGKKKDLQLTQEQSYQAGYLKEDILYTNNQEKLYHVRFQLPASHTWERLAVQGPTYLANVEMVGLNLLDSTTTTYAFEASGKLKYYVVDQQGSLHVVYTYNTAGQLLRYKDCLAPFDNAYWCAYYVYVYKDNKQLAKALSYNLGQDQTPDQKQLFAVDSMVYNEEGLLSERWTLDSAASITQKASYHYNKNRQLCLEISSQWPKTEWTRSYKKTSCYRPNGKLRKQQACYYFGKQEEARQERRYNRRGNLAKQVTYKREQPISLYVLQYKK